MRYVMFVDDVCHGIERERETEREREEEGEKGLITRCS